MVRFLTSGESHGKGLTIIIEGLPVDILVDVNFINNELLRRQRGYGRGRRMAIEKDQIEILSGIRHGRTIGAPITLFIVNRDYENWKEVMTLEPRANITRVTAPRPGHADLSGALKYGLDDIRDVSERASARETASRVAAGAVFKLFLKTFRIEFYSHTIGIGNIVINKRIRKYSQLDNSPLRCMDPKKEKEMMKLIDRAKADGNSLGGLCEVVGTGICPGLGDYTHYDKRLDAKIGHAMLSIPSVKGVEIGPAFENARLFGSAVHDEIFYNKKKGFYRETNRAGGIEGGVSNGEDIIVRLAIKPIPTLGRPLHSVDILSRQEKFAQKERADVCVVPAVGVIGEAMLAFVITNVFLEKFGGDSLDEIKSNYRQYLSRIK